mgnify:CR=1 FL=1
MTQIAALVRRIFVHRVLFARISQLDDNAD